MKTFIVSLLVALTFFLLNQVLLYSNRRNCHCQCLTVDGRSTVNSTLTGLLLLSLRELGSSLLRWGLACSAVPLASLQPWLPSYIHCTVYSQAHSFQNPWKFAHMCGLIDCRTTCFLYLVDCRFRHDHLDPHPVHWHVSLSNSSRYTTFYRILYVWNATFSNTQSQTNVQRWSREAVLSRRRYLISFFVFNQDLFTLTNLKFYFLLKTISFVGRLIISYIP